MPPKRTIPKKAAPPAAKASPAGRPSPLLDTRVVYCGDNLEQLTKLPDACIDLIYIDPPFNSNRNYEVFWGETKEKRAFEDRHASTQAYIDYMRPRCVQLARVLKKTGSFYYHCDDHASHYVKTMLDQIFGHQFFRNEIIWKRTGARGDGAAWNQLHDTLFFYTAGPDFFFHRQFEEYGEEYLETKYRYEEADGRRYRLDNMTSPNPRPNMMYEWRGHASPDNGWRYSRQTMAELDAEGRVWYPNDKSKRPQLKRYLDEMKGVPLGSVWGDIPPVNSQAMERLGYPTQKPLALLERIVDASSNPNDIILDAFCGCGTALVAAQNLGRQWIGIDISPTACRVMAKRLRDVCHLPQSETTWKKDNRHAFVLRELPYTLKQLHAMPHFEFENWAVIGLGGIPNKVQIGDMGIDGRIFPVGTKPSDKDGMFAGDWYPIQVKQSEKLGRPDVDSFEAAMTRDDRQRGFMVAFSFSQDAKDECAAFYKKSGRIIKLIAVQEILDGEHVEKM
ncbi:site-specific DNA-methyltransferase [soil metagenome]